MCPRTTSLGYLAILACAVAGAVAADDRRDSEIHPFFVLMHMRSGSTWFQSTHLAQHPDIYAELELCHGAEGKACVDRIRRFNERCLNHADTRGSQPTWCAFKEVARHVDAAVDMLHHLEASGGRFQKYRVLHLYRANVVKQALSTCVAQATGRWQCKEEPCAKPQAAPMVYAADVMKELSRMIQDTAPQACSVLRQFPADRVLEISYEDLLANETSVVGRVYDFLGVRPWTGWTAARQKSWTAEDPFAVLAPGEKKRLRRMLRSRYGWARLDAALDGDTGFELLSACRNPTGRSVDLPMVELPDAIVLAGHGLAPLVGLLALALVVARRRAYLPPAKYLDLVGGRAKEGQAVESFA